jgi:hypothetical protein
VVERAVDAEDSFALAPQDLDPVGGIHSLGLREYVWKQESACSVSSCRCSCR